MILKCGCKVRHFILNYKHLIFFCIQKIGFIREVDLPLQSCLNNNFMIEQFNFDIRLIFAILNGKVSAAINRKLYRNFRQNGLEISPGTMDGTHFPMGKRRCYTTRVVQCNF